MGSLLSTDEQPLHLVNIEYSLHVTQTEVTVSQYETCVNADVCTIIGMDGEYCTWNEPSAARDDLPINCISRAQASDFSGWTGGRLPSESEWEYIAKSRGMRESYPWGSAPEPTCDYAQYTNSADAGCGLGRPDIVCNHPLGNTLQNVCDMSGNVSEWVLDEYTTNYESSPLDGSANCFECDGNGSFVMRGGSWITGGGTLRTADRSQAPAQEHSSQIGFRLVY